ncbi:hypothetical protein [Mariniplasma anaerobium]|uniref:Uncharacterized protein n=1 Tax=Mariniplasma anaerobium TaxID=2735436 RepID=A0A7U9TGL6_9MOLU|nr:hypothetical protein [Mariniplasma anaerobium]BCR35733.1 hypothetical protein MPAN_006260 [Mariniplasma anaerobium]
MNKIKAFIASYKSILMLKKTLNKTYNIKRYILVYTITFLTMGLIFTVLFPSDTITENLGYVVMSVITIFLGSFLVALYDAEEVFKKRYKLSYSIKTVLFFEGLEKATTIFIIMSLLLSKYFELLAPTYLVVMLFVAAIILGIVVLIVNRSLKDNYSISKSIIIDSVSIYLFFMIIPKVIYIEQIFYAFVVYSLLLLGLLLVKLLLLEYTKFTFIKFKTIKAMFFITLIIIFFTIYNIYDHNVMGKPIIKREFNLDMSDPGGIAYNSLVHEDKIYVLNRRLFVYDLDTGGSEIMYDQVVPGLATNMVVYDDAVHFRYQVSGEEDLGYGYINEAGELIEEVSESSCQVEDYMQLTKFGYTIPKCLGSEDIYLTEDIYYSVDEDRQRALFSTIDTWEIYSYPFTALAYDNYVLAKLNVGQSFFNSTLKIIDVTISGETERQYLKIPKNTSNIKLMDIDQDLMTFIFANNNYISSSVDSMMTYDANGKLLEYLDIYYPYIDYDADDENIYLIFIGDNETFAYKIYVLDKEHIATFVMPKYSKRSEVAFSNPSFDREEKVNLVFEIIFSVMVITIIVVPGVRNNNQKNR